MPTCIISSVVAQDMKNNTKISKKIFLTLIILGFCLSFVGLFAVAQEVEIEYPEVEGAETPRSVKTFLPDYIKYLFNLAIIIAGLVAFASLIYGGFRYLASAGNPTALSDARDQITAGILGLLLLLGAYLVLITINPQLIILKVGEITVNKGVILYTSGATCPGGADPGAAGYEEGVDYMRYTRSTSSLRDLIGGDPPARSVQSIYFFNGNEELEVTAYDKEDFDDRAGNALVFSWVSRGDCVHIGPPFVVTEVKSIQLTWKIPGVYLYAEDNCKTELSGPVLYVGNTADFGDFHDKAMSYKIYPWIKKTRACDTSKPGCSTPDQCLAKPIECLTLETDQATAKFGFILHEHSNFEGDAEAFFGSNNPGSTSNPPCRNLKAGNGGKVQCEPNNNRNESYCREHVNELIAWDPTNPVIRPRASAITIFKQLMLGENVNGNGVTLYSNFNYNEQGGSDPDLQCGPFRPTLEPKWVDKNASPACALIFEGGCGFGAGGGGCASSIRVDGTFIAVLFRNDGRGDVFTGPGDPRLKDNHIGDDRAKYMLVIPISPNQ